MKTLAGLALGIALCAPAYAGCDSFPHKPGQPVTLDTSSDHFIAGLKASFDMGIDLTPADLMAKIKTFAPCSHGSFTVGSTVYEMNGRDSESPARWATAPGFAEPIMFLAASPRPEAAYRMMTQQGSVTFGSGDMMFMLGVAEGNERKIYGYYDAIPPDDTLRRDMCKALTHQLPLLAIYTPQTRKVVLPKDDKPLAAGGCDN